MGWDNVPDDWGQYYYKCGCHASEGGHSCREGQLENAERPWLEHSGYDLEDGTWSKVIALSVHTCRRDHRRGHIKRGDRYRIKTYRCISDEDGSSWIAKSRVVLSRSRK
tara:strand:- start:3508 stop:3834 length:327 start_codon:yes stop_codon:yes gene_type:complete